MPSPLTTHQIAAKISVDEWTRPNGDLCHGEGDDDHHWGAWVIEREKTMRRAIAMAAIKAYERATQ